VAHSAAAQAKKFGQNGCVKLNGYKSVE